MQLVSATEGWLSARAFVDPEVYRLELERVFARRWLFLGHESQIADPGTFVLGRMGTDDVILIRQEDETLAAFLNSCRHRGHPVALDPQGSAPSLTCKYHGWCYGLDGSLRAAPAGTCPMEKDQLGLVAVPRVESVHGFVFGNWDAAAEPLYEHLGDMAWYLKSLVSYLGGAAVTVLQGPSRWRIDCNWKLPAENFAGDLAHAPITHQHAVAAAELSVSPGPSGVEGIGRQFSSGMGHGAIFVYPHIGAFGGPAVDAVATARRGDVTDIEWSAGKGSGTVFPNFSFFGNAHTVRTWNPAGPGSCEVWSWTLGDRNAPADVKAAIVDGSLKSFGQDGSFQRDDDRNWTRIQTGLAGDYTRTTRLHLGSRTDGLAVDEGVPGVTADAMCDLARRGFFLRWSHDLANARQVARSAEEQFRSDLAI